jgi:hypothetical protein
MPSSDGEPGGLAGRNLRDRCDLSSSVCAAPSRYRPDEERSNILFPFLFPEFPFFLLTLLTLATPAASGFAQVENMAAAVPSRKFHDSMSSSASSVVC